jgi:hypothetical protein
VGTGNVIPILEPGDAVFLDLKFIFKAKESD